MSACNIIKTEDAIYMFTDAASYWGDGTLGAVGQKVAILGHQNAAISCRGPKGFGDQIAGMVNCAFASFDELVQDFAVVVESAYECEREQFASCATGPEVEVFLAGWSESRNRPESYVVTSHGLYGDAWRLIALGPVAVAPFDAALDERCAAMEPSDDIVAAGLALMEEQRKVRGQHAEAGPAVGGVGGFCQMTVIRPQSIQTAIVKRWDDRIGEVLGAAA